MQAQIPAPSIPHALVLKSIGPTYVEPLKIVERRAIMKARGMMQHNKEEERNAAYREAGRAVAVALLGFTLQAVSVLPTRDDSGAIATQGLTAFSERPSATSDELTFIAAAGIWAELQAETLPDKGTLDMESIFSRLAVNRKRIDVGKLRFGLDYLVKNYRNAVLEIARQLLQRKIINGIECGKIILAHRPGQKQPS